MVRIFNWQKLALIVARIEMRNTFYGTLVENCCWRWRSGNPEYQELGLFPCCRCKPQDVATFVAFFLETESLIFASKLPESVQVILYRRKPQRSVFQEGFSSNWLDIQNTKNAKDFAEESIKYREIPKLGRNDLNSAYQNQQWGTHDGQCSILWLDTLLQG